MVQLRVAGATLVSCLVMSGCDGGYLQFKQRFAGSAETVGDNIYVVGGMNLSGSLRSVGAYNIATKSWKRMRDIPTARGAPGSAVVGNNIYVVGGRNEDSVLSTCEQYVVGEDRWASCAPMPTARWGLMTAAAGGQLYAFGGISGVGDNRRALDVVEVYDPTSDSWEQLGKMPQLRHDAAVASVDGRIYVVSGKVASFVENTSSDLGITDRVDYFDPIEGRWSQVEDIPNGRSGAKAIVSNGLIFIVGGASNDSRLTTSIDVFDPGANQWISGPSLSTGRGAHLAALAADSIIVIGGLRSTGSINTWMESVSVSEYQR